MAVRIHPDRWPVAVLMIGATLWSVAPLLAALLCGSVPRHQPDSPIVESDPVEVTTIVRIGDEPDQLAANAIAIARTLGPVAVIGRRPGVDLGEGVADHCGVPLPSALELIGEHATTSSILMISGRAVIRPDDARRAAAHVAGGAQWVRCVTRSFNDDRFAPDCRDRLGALLRHQAHRANLWLWEPDATFVATPLLRNSPPVTEQPLGRWLRGRANEGLEGVVTDDVPTVRASPVSPQDHWPDTILRQRAAVADLADAAVRPGSRSGSLRARVVAIALLLRELYAWPLTVWLMAPVLLASGTPFRINTAVGTAALLGLAVARWAFLRRLLGAPLAPRWDVLAAINGIPGSLWSLASALRRRVTRPLVTLPTRPLVWAAIPVTVAAGVGLVSVTPGTPGSRTTALLCIVLLVGLWSLTVRALVERTWDRLSFRLPVSIEATLNGHPARVVDAGPTGAAVEAVGRPALAPADEIELTVLDPGDGVPLRLSGVITSRRRRPASTRFGIELHPDGNVRQRWVECLMAAPSAQPGRSVSTGPCHPDVRTGRPTTAATWIDRATVTVVLAVSLLVLVALALVLLGFRPHVVRSGSMAPTLYAGDVVVSDRVPASELRDGDVVTLDHYQPIDESLTHRVRAIERRGSTLHVTTQGDANRTGETWSVPEDELIGRVVASVRGVGRPALLVRSSGPFGIIAVVTPAILISAMVWGRRRPTRA